MKKSPRLFWYGVLAFITLLICCTIIIVYMHWEAGTVEVTALTVPGAPERIVFIADPHVRPENLEHTREVIRVINSLHPSVVLIGGIFPTMSTKTSRFRMCGERSMPRSMPFLGTMTTWPALTVVVLTDGCHG